MKPFRGTVAVVTGASGGIGEAIAMALAREGTRLVLAGRNADKLELVAERARDLSPGVEIFAADLAEDEHLQALAARAIGVFGGVNLLVHAIGVFVAGPIETSPVEDLDRQYRVNT
ncbi:SDR family oxidoreductase, partial [bacterium]